MGIMGNGLCVMGHGYKVKGSWSLIMIPGLRVKD